MRDTLAHPRPLGPGPETRQLIGACVAGAPGAFEQLTARSEAWLRRHVAWLLAFHDIRDQNDVDYILQRVWCVVHFKGKLRTLLPAAGAGDTACRLLGALLRGVASSQVRGFVRVRNKRRCHEVAADPTDPVIAEALHQDLSLQDYSRRLAELAGELPQHLQEIWREQMGEQEEPGREDASPGYRRKKRHLLKVWVMFHIFDKAARPGA
jgi:hypothetical protein